MLVYLCQRCPSCKSEYMLEMIVPGCRQASNGDSWLESFECSTCGALFSAESYFVLQSTEPLETILTRQQVGPVSI